MKITDLYIQNYGSWRGRHHVPLADRGLVMVLGQNLDDPRAKSNGAGKSTWIDALDWCLFGEHPRGDAADTVVSHGAPEGVVVTVAVLGDDGTEIRVTRSRDVAGVAPGPKLFVGGQEKTALDTRETQALIQRALGLDRVVFHAAVLFGQHDGWKFADAKDSERKDLLSRILPELGEVDELLTRVEALLPQAREVHMRAVTAAAGATANLEAALRVDPSIRPAQWESARAARVADLGRDIEAADRHITALATELRTLEQQEPPAPAPLLPPPELEQARARLRAQDVATQQTSQWLAELRGRAQMAQAAIKRLSDPKATSCGACGQLLGDAARQHVAAELTKAQQEFDDLVVTGQKARAEADAAAQTRAQLAQVVAQHEESWRALSAAHGAREAEVRAWHAARDLALRRVREAGAAATALRHRWADVVREANPYTGDVAAHQAEVARARGAVAQHDAAVAAATRRLAMVEFWRTGLGAKGLKSYLLDARLGEMAAEANRWVRLLTGGTTWVEFSTQREVGKGKTRKLVEDFSIQVRRSNPDGTVTSQNYRSWSGGERYRIALGIDFGLARLVARRARRSYDMLVLDEVFQHLDATGKEAVAEMLFELAKEKSSLFVIDHDEQFQHLFEQKMIIRKKHRASSVVGGTHYGFEPESPESGSTESQRGRAVLEDHPAFPGEAGAGRRKRAHAGGGG